MFPLALPASAARFLHSGIQIYLPLPLHFARIRSVEMTVVVSGTFDEPKQPENLEYPEKPESQKELSQLPLTVSDNNTPKRHSIPLVGEKDPMNPHARSATALCRSHSAE